ncbi:LysR family transcriptional regulator [Marinobacter hydrocarbonoclasticus]|nr:LysR family transcriptional regulator [Marinobacter nauticus]
MIELRQLETLNALAQQGSLTAAAEALQVTPSALSHQFREWEQRLGAPLFVRKSRPLKLTGQGQILLALAQEVLPKVAAAQAALNAPRRLTGTLRIGVDCHSCFRWLLPQMEAFERRHHGLSLDLSSRFPFAALEALQQGELDLVLTADPRPLPRLASAALFEFEMRLVMAVDHPLSKQAHIEPADLAGVPLLSYPVPSERLDLHRLFLDPAGIRPGPRRTSEMTQTLLQRLAVGDGVAALPSWSLPEGQQLSLCHRPLGRNGLWRTLHGVWRQDSGSAAVRGFLETLQSPAVAWRTETKKPPA